jgi:hypothetical protein
VARGEQREREVGWGVAEWERWSGRASRWRCGGE